MSFTMRPTPASIPNDTIGPAEDAVPATANDELMDLVDVRSSNFNVTHEYQIIKAYVGKGDKGLATFRVNGVRGGRSDLFEYTPETLPRPLTEPFTVDQLSSTHNNR
ncbi:hypothetical protein LTR70_007841 [Exophiala xenobiotica]|uniref:Uncharacterized protein n=1 Tax=Lithohypha guttulata TaxID=1690604 RepID=A0ABR0JZL4_9EURO|nr:hypothetical protein LTR24_008548 [Lithohypha guttulata]KAK5313001.1 hypothetical protein LTR70_007841 [Exophiala xenobiotica]